MDEAFRAENRRKYHQTEDTCPFLQEPLASHFGSFGEGPETNNLLQGEYSFPQNISQETKEFLQT